jgi:hypothetical protein
VEFVVSEMPVFLKLLPHDLVSPQAVARDITLYLDSLGTAVIPFDSVDAGSSDDIRITRLFTYRKNLACADLPVGKNNTSLAMQLYACDHFQCDSASFTVTLVDTISPNVLLKKHSAYLNSSGQLLVQAHDFVSSMQDNCAGPISLSLSKNSFDCSDLQEEGNITIVSDISWRKSTYSSLVNAMTWPWLGAGDFPDDSTYSDSVQLGQPYQWHSIDAVQGSEVIKAGSRVQYFRKSFDLNGNVLKAGFSVTVDDDMEIYLNGKLIARENVWGAPSSGPMAVHAFEILANGSYTNGQSGFSAFGLVNGLPLAHYFLEGENEILLVVRNGGTGNVGGFSFKMDLETTLSTHIVSDSSWEKSTLISSLASLSFPWLGAQELPQAASFSNTALVGQPKAYKTIDSVFGAEVIKCGSDIEFYRKKFQVKGNYWSGLRL